MPTNCGSNVRLSHGTIVRVVLFELLRLKAAKKHRYTSEQAPHFAKNEQPRRSRAGRELALTMPASVAYTRYSCASYSEVCGHCRVKSVVTLHVLIPRLSNGDGICQPLLPPHSLLSQDSPYPQILQTNRRQIFS